MAPNPKHETSSLLNLIPLSPLTSYNSRYIMLYQPAVAKVAAYRYHGALFRADPCCRPGMLKARTVQV